MIGRDKLKANGVPGQKAPERWESTCPLNIRKQGGIDPFAQGVTIG